MDQKEREEVLEILQEELLEFFRWMLQELGEDYYMEDPHAPRFSWEPHVDRRIRERLRSDRALLWERDPYAAFEHELRPSIYQVMKAKDLEIIHHYQDDLYCEHFKIEDLGYTSESGDVQQLEKRYDESFSVILASQHLGYMYRLDMCDVCGLIEVWSMRYDRGEISLWEN